MARKPYPTDLTDDPWERLEPLLPPPKSGTPRGGRPAADTREVANAVLYLPTPGTPRVDCQTVETTRRGGPKGYDGGKKGGRPGAGDRPRLARAGVGVARRPGE